MYKTFKEWKNGNWLEDGEPRKEAYTRDELLLVEMGWKYGFDAGKAQKVEKIAELEKDLEGCEYFLNKTKPLSDEEINQIAKDELIGWACDEDMLSFARAIEERHGIK